MCVFLYICISLCISLCISACISACISVCISLLMCVRIYVCLNACCRLNCMKLTKLNSPALPCRQSFKFNNRSALYPHYRLCYSLCHKEAVVIQQTIPLRPLHFIPSFPSFPAAATGCVTPATTFYDPAGRRSSALERNCRISLALFLDFRMHRLTRSAVARTDGGFLGSQTLAVGQSTRLDVCSSHRRRSHNKPN